MDSIKHLGEVIENVSDPFSISRFSISLRYIRNLSQEKLRAHGIFDYPPLAQNIRDLTFEQAVRIIEDKS